MIINKSIRQALVDIIQKNIPQGQYAAHWMSENLKMEKESAYRRLRGDVMFSFEEVVAIASKLGFSLDSMLELQDTKHALFNVDALNNTSSFIDNYRDKLVYYAELFRNDDMSLKQVRFAVNTIPYFFTLISDAVAKFRLYKRTYQMEKKYSSFALADYEIPEYLQDVHALFADSILNIPYVTLVLDENVFRSFIRDILFFRKRKLINDDELHDLQTGLFRIIDKLEDLATNGFHAGNGKIDIYLSTIDLDTSYFHLEFRDREISQMRLYSITALDTQNIEVCREQKIWIDSLKRFSILVSQSSEIQRFEYLEKQREYVRSIDI